MRDISKIRWNIKCFDECVSLHWLIKDVARVLEKYIKGFGKIYQAYSSYSAYKLG